MLAQLGNLVLYGFTLPEQLSSAHGNIQQARLAEDFDGVEEAAMMGI